MNVLSTKSATTWGYAEYYIGKTYTHQGSLYAITDSDIKKAKQYKSESVAKSAAYSLSNKSGMIFEVEKLSPSNE